MIPHLAASFNLARCLLKHPQDAEDAVQTAYMKAFRAFDQFSNIDGDGKQSAAWMMKIVRNTCFTQLKKDSTAGSVVEFDTVRGVCARHDVPEALIDSSNRPERTWTSNATQQLVWQAIDTLPTIFREVIVLREIEELSYGEIAEVTSVPLGTVMSRLSRARRQLHDLLQPQLAKESLSDVR